MKSFLPLVVLSLAPLGALWAQSASPSEVRVAPVKMKEAKEAGATTKVAKFAPLAYFDANCARCHGPNGSFYGAEFGKGLKDDAALKQIVAEMCEGPGGAPLEGESLEILTEFHRTLRDGKPFATVVSKNETEWKGEASPDSKVTLESGGKSVAAEQKGNVWSVKLPAEFERKGAKVVARRGETVSEVEAS